MKFYLEFTENIYIYMQIINLVVFNALYFDFGTSYLILGKFPLSYAHNSGIGQSKIL